MELSLPASEPVCVSWGGLDGCTQTRGPDLRCLSPGGSQRQSLGLDGAGFVSLSRVASQWDLHQPRWGPKIAYSDTGKYGRLSRKARAKFCGGNWALRAHWALAKGTGWSKRSNLMEGRRRIVADERSCGTSGDRERARIQPFWRRITGII